jgi:cyclopropane fatty-acyl-phospholipid synthase-like methyltransferase
MSRRFIKSIIFKYKIFFEITLFPIILLLDLTAKAASYYLNIYYKIIDFNDWHIKKIVPNHFKHLSNLYSWPFDPNRNQFTTAPALARSFLKKNDNVLDICCGDGSISYLFFSDIACQVDAIDWSKDAIAFAKKTFSKQNINYINDDIFNLKVNKTHKKFNLIYFGSGYDYFKKSERKRLFFNLKSLIASNGYIIIKTPIWDKNNYMNNQIEAKNDFASGKEVFKNELRHFFDIEFSRTVTYTNRVEIIAVCKYK